MNFEQNKSKILPSGRSMDEWLEELAPKVIKEPLPSTNFVRNIKLHFFLNFKENMFDLLEDKRYGETYWLLFKQSIAMNIPNHKYVLFKGQRLDIMLPKISFSSALNSRKALLFEAKGYYLEIVMMKRTKRDFLISQCRVVDFINEETLEYKVIKEL